MDLPQAVLFCCTMNSVRSPMALGIMKRLHGTRVFVDSVGVRAGELDGFVIEVMEEIGIDLTRHNSKTFEDLEDDSFDVVVSLSPEAQHKAVDMVRYMACEVEFWRTFDPSLIEGSRDVRLDAYRAVRDELMGKIRTRFPVPRMSSG
ncbi:MAG: arsenate reductase ArsC [Rhodospirillaceae bacterium]